VARTGVQIGQRYREVGAGIFGQAKPLWIVDEVFTASDSLRYAVLSKIGDPTLRKTLSIQVLSYHQRFVPEPGPATQNTVRQSA
jgi:ABC-type transport system involved in cytochrome c biogenesis ATPase subunit